MSMWSLLGPLWPRVELLFGLKLFQGTVLSLETLLMTFPACSDFLGLREVPSSLVPPPRPGHPGSPEGAQLQSGCSSEGRCWETGCCQPFHTCSCSVGIGVTFFRGLPGWWSVCRSCQGWAFSDMVHLCQVSQVVQTQRGAQGKRRCHLCLQTDSPCLQNTLRPRLSGSHLKSREFYKVIKYK